MNKPSPPISVLILTKNERQDLPGCIRSVASWCDDIHVYDSGSTDDTVAIARAMGAQVTERTYPGSDAPFGGDESAHRNWGLRHIPFKHNWVLLLDADERATLNLLDVATRRLSQSPNCAAFRFCRRDHLWGTWLKHVTPSPMHIRLIRPEKIRYDRLINTVAVVDGAIEDLDTHFDHFPFSKGITHWFTKHNGYSDLEARLITESTAKLPEYKWHIALFGRDVSERRLHQKGLYYRMPFRPLVMFLALYVGKRGFLDGRAGFVFAILRAIYEYMITLKVEELESVQKG